MTTYKHGDGRPYAPAPEYIVWKQMKQRCCNKRNPDYLGDRFPMYMGWLNSYENFLRDVGRRPGWGWRLLRKELLLGFMPGNMVWFAPGGKRKAYREAKC